MYAGNGCRRRGEPWFLFLVVSVLSLRGALSTTMAASPKRSSGMGAYRKPAPRPSVFLFYSHAILLTPVVRGASLHQSNSVTPVGCPSVQLSADPLPGDGIRSHRGRVQSHKMLPPTSFPCQLQAQVVPTAPSSAPANLLEWPTRTQENIFLTA